MDNLEVYPASSSSFETRAKRMPVLRIAGVRRSQVNFGLFVIFFVEFYDYQGNRPVRVALKPIFGFEQMFYLVRAIRPVHRANIIRSCDRLMFSVKRLKT